MWIKPRAAEKAGFESVWCWVEEMDDDTAFMELATSNNQGELSPLEVGMHALHYVDKSTGGRGNKGGLSAYAEKVGRHAGLLTDYRHAAEVVQTIHSSEGLLNKAKHLAAIHKLPEETWQEAVDVMLKKGWSAKDTGDRVKSACNGVKELGDTQGWITPAEAALMVIGDFITPTTIKQITEKIGEVRAYAKEHEAELTQHAKRNDLAQYFFEQSIASKAINVRHFAELYQELVDIVESMESHWLEGNWADHLDTLADGSIDLVLTDPPYGMEYQSNFRKEKHKIIEGDGSTDAFADSVEALLPKMKVNAHVLAFVNWKNEASFIQTLEGLGLTVKSSIVWVKNNTSMGDLEGAFAPKHERIIHAVKGKPKLYTRCADVIECARQNTDRHPTEKPTDILVELIDACTVRGQLVVDPFAGVASTPAACIQTDRKYWACEIDTDYYKIGKQRLG